ncbi:Mce-associated membrane protein [Mycolicibacterium sp. BK556]|uniref:mammalian cell entry protein n=1 Tax=Mycobacteriaceae TaxID=1762 RepID=UPI00105FEA35|nr:MULTISPECIES: mammalian cell entry protein [Mycobacteriaceae]MBB3600373.1 Mce-associated membrane protein [Mycolicibacterium sp. BK556]MBB3630125.1 Mce-associated membrane protein [Mycolicibacterium sp. BK607]MBB3748123.1 Mce-associated membrane protein [Mycolicibacterium sp. BK634]TDO09940.1 Mce-associated membrane protein [Mycobacterium sp. BK086]
MADDVDAAGVELDDAAAVAEEPISARGRSRSTRLAAAILLLTAAALATIAGWEGFHAYRSEQADREGQVFLQVARQGALNLTTIDYQHAQADVARILDGSTGTFHDEFQSRSQPFIDVVTKAQSTSTGTISEAALESTDGDRSAQALIAVQVAISNKGADPTKHGWRMRIVVDRSGDIYKISSVQFVP